MRQHRSWTMRGSRWTGCFLVGVPRIDARGCVGSDQGDAGLVVVTMRLHFYGSVMRNHAPKDRPPDVR